MDDLKTLQKEWREKSADMRAFEKTKAGIVEREERLNDKLAKCQFERERLSNVKKDAYEQFARGSIKDDTLKEASAACVNAEERERDIVNALKILQEERERINALITNLRSNTLSPLTCTSPNIADTPKG